MPEFQVAHKYYIEAVIDNMEGLRIVLSDSDHEDSKIEIVFDNSVHAYRNTDESYRQRIIQYIDVKYGTKFYSEWTFFKVVNSEYLKWISNQSYSIADSEKLIHYSIVAADSILDIITAYEPRIEKYK